MFPILSSEFTLDNLLLNEIIKIKMLSAELDPGADTSISWSDRHIINKMIKFGQNYSNSIFQGILQSGEGEGGRNLKNFPKIYPLLRPHLTTSPLLAPSAPYLFRFERMKNVPGAF